MQQQQLIRLPAVEQQTGLKRSSIYELVRDGQFPKPVKINKRAIAWVEAEVQEWIAERIESRKGGAAA